MPGHQHNFQSADSSASLSQPALHPNSPTRNPTRTPAANAHDAANSAHHHHHPPPRPPLRNNFELEPNPFEQSFSASSSSLSSLRQSINQKSDPSPPSSGNKSPESTARDVSPSRRQSMSSAPAHPNGDTPKPILPPLASITSPSDPSYAWAFSSAGLTNSLRAGPLSPAMLAGPQTQPTTTSQPSASIAALAASAGSGHPSLFPFDPSGSFRTGLTPSTGLTPLVGGPVAFPPPSPNTAAFLAMVNSGTAGSAGAATITPNTLNALAGVLGQSTSNTNTTQTNQQSNGVSANNSNNGANSNGSESSSSTQSQGIAPTSVAPSQVAAPGSSTYQNSSVNSQSRGNNSSSYNDASSAANHAANGLFLLSQAHQELTKREEAQKQSMAQANGAAKGSEAQSQAATNGTSSAKRGSKRKVETASVTSNSSAKTGPSKKFKSTSSVSTRASAARRGSTASNQEGDDGEDEDSDDEDQLPPPSSSNKQKKFETEEEKRRNFLERNRQAALKCRQRKKQWLAQLQAKNEYLQNENERLTAALVASREEISRLSQLVGGAGVGLPSGVVPMVGVAGMGAQHQQVHHTPYLAHQQQHHPIAVPVSLPQGSSGVTATAASPPLATKASPRMQQHHSQQQQVLRSPNPHSPTSDGRSSRSSFRDVRDYTNGASTARDNGAREYTRDMREREMGHVHGHAPQAIAVNGRGYGY